MFHQARLHRPHAFPRTFGVAWLVLLSLLLGTVLVFYSSRHGAVATGSLTHLLPKDPVSREEILSIARSYAEHHWQATSKNVRHSLDAHGVQIETPDSPTGASEAGKWHVDAENIGLPYKWGGFDTPQSFDAGLKSGKAAGDVYSTAKRSAGNAGVSDEAVGIDCSGFISRCWKLPQKLGTATLPGLCRALDSPDYLQPGDIMDAPHGHVVLFIKWLDASKSSALFYEAEAEPQPKVVTSEHRILWLRLCGARPYRYLRIQD